MFAKKNKKQNIRSRYPAFIPNLSRKKITFPLNSNRLMIHIIISCNRICINQKNVQTHPQDLLKDSLCKWQIISLGIAPVNLQPLGDNAELVLLSWCVHGGVRQMPSVIIEISMYVDKFMDFYCILLVDLLIPAQRTIVLIIIAL